MLSRHQNAGKIHNVKIANRPVENVSKFRYLGTTVTNHSLIQEEIKRRLSSGNACYHSVQNLLSSRLLSKNVKIRIYKTIILPVVLYGYEIWSLTLREEHRLRVFENTITSYFVLFAKYNDNDQVKEMGRACTRYGQGVHAELC
jgi:hypothetical protein